jgi:hypothetical protein
VEAPSRSATRASVPWARPAADQRRLRRRAAVCASRPANDSGPTGSECNDLQQDETDLEGQDLAPLQADAIRYLLEGARLSSVASSLGISRSTLWRWTKTPEWRAAISRERELLRTVVRAQLETLAAESIHVLDSALRGKDKRLALRAALAMLQGIGALPGRDSPKP